MFVPIENLSLIWITGERSQSFDPWPLSSESSLACHTQTLYNDHLRGPVTLTPVAERGAVTTCSVPTEDRTPISACESNILPLSYPGGEGHSTKY